MTMFSAWVVEILALSEKLDFQRDMKAGDRRGNFESSSFAEDKATEKFKQHIVINVNNNGFARTF